MTTSTFPYDDVDFTYAPGPFVDLAETDLGQTLWQFLTQPHIVHAMVIAVRLGAAPVSAISEDLLTAFGSGDPYQQPKEALMSGLQQRFPIGQSVSLDQIKRMIGHMIRQILGQLGLTIRTRNSPANDPLGIFTTSARYEAARTASTP